MYDVAAQLDPDSYLRLARATYAEMALAGITSVGEFHYLHHAPGGRPYDDPNAMGEALREAARDAGVRLTLLDTCYLAGGLTEDGHEPLNPEQLRFGDADVDVWADRMLALREDDGMRSVGPSTPYAPSPARRSRPWWPPPVSGPCTRTCPSSGPRTTRACGTTASHRPDYCRTVAR